jgi:protein-ribulosamine 3-kinase
MPLEINLFLQKYLPGVPGLPPLAELRMQQIGGGSINAAYQLSTLHNARWFAKFNHIASFPDLFPGESDGLALLRHNGAIRVPETIACLQGDGYQLLLLEWIDSGLRTPGFWKVFGEQLAALHRQTARIFGLPHDNYMGALPQDNSPSPDWITFFIKRRLEPQLRLATDAGLLDKTVLQHFQGLYARLPDLFPTEPPALLHGDLWSGNFLCDTNSRPVLIDPAVYYGHRSMDLAMTTLFGGFEKPFYEAYNHHYPFPPDHRRQWDICNLYPLLIHLNLFGPSYQSQILNTIRSF